MTTAKGSRNNNFAVAEVAHRPRGVDTSECRRGTHECVDGILRAGWQPAPGGHLRTSAGGVPNRRRLTTRPTSRHLPSLYFAGLTSLAPVPRYNKVFP